ncbi:MAG: hypothetical protein FJ214_00845 [Ignavibacteria bacterium]|nr:hypothetical protein [Ignavibacteria bacterium]
MKKLLSILLPLSIAFLINSSSCKKEEGTEPKEPTEENVVGTIGSLQGGTVKTNSGYEITVIPGTVPQNQNGQSANVTFSIEVPVTPPKEISSTAEKRGDYTKLGPEGFTFRWPVRITFPYRNTTDPSELKLLFYDALSSSWKVVPISMVDKDKKVIGADVMELGYYVVAKVGQSAPKITAEDSDGGFEFAGDATYYYTLTVASVTNFKYAWQSASWYSGRIVGSTGSTGSQPTGGPRPPTRIHLVQATYQVWISRTTPGTLSTLPKIETYTVPASGTISQPVTYSGPLSSGSGWTTLSMPGGGTWVQGTPQGWAVPTVTYGTGDFQATLTWVNTSTNASDVDLHLYGPNNMHVYWSSPKSSDNSVELDRDWQRTVGNAVENIYSLKTMPTGSYNLKVNLYTGNPASYRVRVINKGSVKSYIGNLSTINSSEDQSKMVTIETFTK